MPYIGTEHLLLGLVREDEGIAAEVLRSLGASLEKIRHTDDTKPSWRIRCRRRPTKKRESKTPLTDQLGFDLTARAEDGKLDPVIGREKEIERVIQILSRRTKNNPALIGEPGVGKTAIVEGLAQRIIDGDVPETLIDKRVLMLDVGSLVAGTMYRGQFEERLKKVIEEITNSDAILFIDEVHMLVGAGAAGSSVDAANILKPALARGETAVHRRDDPRRVSQVHRRRRRAGAPLPAGAGGRADHRGDDRDPEGRPHGVRGASPAQDQRRGAAAQRRGCRPATCPIASCPTRPST